MNHDHDSISPSGSSLFWFISYGIGYALCSMVGIRSQHGSDPSARRWLLVLLVLAVAAFGAAQIF